LSARRRCVERLQICPNRTHTQNYFTYHTRRRGAILSEEKIETRDDFLVRQQCSAGLSGCAISIKNWMARSLVRYVSALFPARVQESRGDIKC
jgi:hypothetical protein